MSTMFEFIKSVCSILIFDGKKRFKAVWLVLLVRLLNTNSICFHKDCVHYRILLWPRGEKFRPSAVESGNDSSYPVRWAVHLRGSYDQYRILVSCLMELLKTWKKSCTWIIVLPEFESFVKRNNIDFVKKSVSINCVIMWNRIRKWI